MESHLPLILIELVLVFGGALLFGWWQFREIKRDRASAARRKALEEQASQSIPDPRSDMG